jgi:hypothetical protein
VSSVQVKLGSLAAHSLAASKDPDPERLALLLPRAIRFYFEERERDRSDWRYPPFLDGTRLDGDAREVGLPDDLWQEVQAEADRQEVPPQDLVQHAVFYYGAARDEGRLTQRIAEELQREEEAGGSS